jgi:hypothetical protein
MTLEESVFISCVVFEQHRRGIHFIPQKRLKHGRQNITLDRLNSIIRNNKCIFTKLNAVCILQDISGQFSGHECNPRMVSKSGNPGLGPVPNSYFLYYIFIKALILIKFLYWSMFSQNFKNFKEEIKVQSLINWKFRLCPGYNFY